MNRNEQEAARQAMIDRMQQGDPWNVAAAAVGYTTSRTAAYCWRQRYDREGVAGLVDQRHGHPSKLRPAIQDWIVAYCQAHPGTPSHVLQAAIAEAFHLQVGLTQIRVIRRRVGLSPRQPRTQKKPR